MAGPTLSLLQYLRVTSAALSEDSRSDAELLSRYAKVQDETAFAALVVRHGPLVWGICRQVLGNMQDVEDAFQSTFLALSHKAGQIHVQETLAGWLHRVARRAALDVYKAAGARQRLQGQLQARIRQEAPHQFNRNDIYEVLHAELEDLAEKLRVPLVLHYLEGKTQVEVARILGISEPAVRKRLARGESVLRERLSQRGICARAVTLATLLQELSSNAAVPTSLVRRTVEATMAFRNGKLDGPTAALARQLLQSVPYGSGWLLKGWLIVLVCASGLGAGAYVYRAASLLSLRVNADGPPQVTSVKEVSPRSSEDKVGSPQPSENRVSKDKASQTHLDDYGDSLPEQALARLGTLRLRHAGAAMNNEGVNSVLFTFDGKSLVTTGSMNPIRLWDVSTGKLLCQWGKAHLYSDVLIVLSPDKRTLAGVNFDGTVSFWDITTGKSRQWNQFNVTALIFSPDGKTLTGIGRDNHIRVREVASGKELRNHRLNITGDDHVCAFSADGKTLVTIDAQNGKPIELWDVITGKKLHQLPKMKGAFLARKLSTHVSFSPNGRLLAIASISDTYNNAVEQADGVVHLWDVATGREVQQFGSDQAGTNCVTFSPDGKLLATGSAAGFIRLWDVATGKELRCCQGYRAHINALAFSPDGKWLASGASGNDQAARLWEVVTGKEISPSRGGHTGAILSVTFSPNGKSLISGGRDGTVRTWDIEAGREQRAPLPAGDFQSPAALSPDGKTIVSIGNTFTPNGGLFLSAALSSPSTIRFWDVVTGQERRQLPGAIGCAQSTMISPDGKAIISLAFGPILTNSSMHVWDMATGKELYHIQGGFPDGLAHAAVSPRGKVFAAVSWQGTLTLRKIATGKTAFQCQATAKNQPGAVCLTFSADGQLLATSGIDTSMEKNQPTEKHTIRLWSIPPDNPWALDAFASPLFGHTDLIYAVAFSPDGKTLASAGRDGTLRLWEVATGKERHCFKGGHQGDVWCLAFAPDGRRLASGSNDTTIMIWDVTNRLDHGRLRPVQLAAKQVEQLWAELASADTVRAYQAIWTLVAAAEQIVPFLKKQLRPVPFDKMLDQRVAQLVVELDNDAFKVRKKALDALKKLGELAEPALRQAMKKPASVEAKKRIEGLLKALEGKRHAPPGDECRRIRTLEVLEQCHTQEARQLLEELAQGAPGAQLTQDAQTILKRWNR